MSNDAVSAFLFGSGAKAFQFDKIGDTCVGEVISAEMRQQTDLDTGELMTWKDGSPRMQLVIQVQTKDHDDDDDDGVRVLYAKGGNFDVAEGEGTSMRDAIKDALKDADAKSIEPGDQIAVSHTGLGSKQRGKNPPKLYTAGFKKASRAVAAKDLFGPEGDPEAAA